MFKLEDSPGFLVNKAALAMKRALEERLARYGLTAPQWAVLATLWGQDGLPQVALCRTLFFDKPTITGIVKRLEAKGLVRRERDDEDARVLLVCLTKEGRDLEEKLPPLAADVNGEALRGISASERKVFMRCLIMVWDNLNT